MVVCVEAEEAEVAVAKEGIEVVKDLEGRWVAEEVFMAVDRTRISIRVRTPITKQSSAEPSRSKDSANMV